MEKAGSQQRLFDLCVLGEGQPSRVIAKDIRLDLTGGGFVWAPDGQKLAYRSLGMEADGQVYVVGLDDAEPSLVTSGDHPEFDNYSHDAPLWDPSSRHVYFVDGESLWRASLESASATEVVKLTDWQPMLLEQSDGLIMSPDGGASTVVFARHKTNGTCGFLRIGLDGGKVTELQVEEKAYGGYIRRDGFAVSDDARRVVYVAQDTAHGPDLHVLDVGQDGVTPRRLTVINPALEGYAMGSTQLVEWRTIDGAPCRGVLLLPAGYQPGERYPMITKVYGGAKPSESSVCVVGVQRPQVDSLQLYATRGYAVFLPDIPFEHDKNEGTVVSDLVNIVMPGVDKVVEVGIADPDRLGLTGHSFGGYNTIALITRTTRFRAAMMSAGLANMISAYGGMAEDGTTYGILVIENGQFLVHGTPWEKPAYYLENSPIFHLDRVQTPLLITHGGADEGVPAFLADEIFVGLRRLGKEVVYARYEGAGHHQGGWSFANQLDFTVVWFDEHLKASAEPTA